MQLDIEKIRNQFPALALKDDGQRRVYLDNPAGTQVPLTVIDAISDCLRYANANVGGPFASSIAADAVVAAAHDSMADLL
ncbi:MAG: cysteine desulfurase-like protein, partial [Gammaproteobacteria bacterium]|nr:cysteine desulfurase-like protein [Gammaproteobacteria bacterium]